MTALTTLGLALGVGAASAHVSVNPNTATAGSYTKLTFRVPNESAKASTVAVTVTFPVDHPFASVSVRKQPGWTATSTTSKLAKPIADDDNATITQAVSAITWKADASGQIALGQFAEFDVSVGPVPAVASLMFTAIQTYSDGSVVRWDQPTAGATEPQYPAPVLTIAPAEAPTVDHHGGPTATGSAGTATVAGSGGVPAPGTVAVTAGPVGVAVAAGDSDGAARTLGVVGIIVGALGLLLGAVALRSRTGRARP